jgi:hypothetical protein
MAGLSVEGWGGKEERGRETERWIDQPSVCWM